MIAETKQREGFAWVCIIVNKGGGLKNIDDCFIFLIFINKFSQRSIFCGTNILTSYKLYDLKLILDCDKMRFREEMIAILSLVTSVSLVKVWSTSALIKSSSLSWLN